MRGGRKEEVGSGGGGTSPGLLPGLHPEQSLKEELGWLWAERRGQDRVLGSTTETITCLRNSPDMLPLCRVSKQFSTLKQNKTKQKT